MMFVLDLFFFAHMRRHLKQPSAVQSDVSRPDMYRLVSNNWLRNSISLFLSTKQQLIGSQFWRLKREADDLRSELQHDRVSGLFAT
jgi:hypothetical protein